MSRTASILAVLLLWPALAGADKARVDTAMAMALFDPTVTPANLVKSLEPIDQETLPTLRDYLGHSIAGYRAAAATALAAIGGSAEAPLLVPLLGDESSQVRQAAATALSPFAGGLVEPILAWLQKPDPLGNATSELTADLLAKAGPSAILPIAVALRERARPNAAVCARALATFPPAQLIDAYLRPGLDHEFAWAADHRTLVGIFKTGVALVVSNRAAHQREGDRLRCALWFRAFTHPDYEDAALSLTVIPLTDFDPQRAGCSAADFPEVSADYEEAMRDRQLQKALAKSLMQAATPERRHPPQTETIEGLIEQLFSPDAATRGRAAEALGKTGDSRAIGPLLKLFQSRVDPEAVAIEYQEEVPVYEERNETRTYYTPGRGSLTDLSGRSVPDPGTVWRDSVTVKKKIGTTMETKTRMDTSADRDAIDQSRASAIRALVKLGGVSFREVQNFWNNEYGGPDAKAFDPRLSVQEQKSMSRANRDIVLKALTDALVSLDRDAAVEVFRNALRSQDSWVVDAAVYGLTRIGTTEALALAAPYRGKSNVGANSGPKGGGAWPAGWR